VVPGDPVDAELAAGPALVDEHPLTVRPGRHPKRLHPAAAVGRPVAGHPAVDVEADQAARTVVAVRGARGVHGHVQAAAGAAESVRLPSVPAARDALRPLGASHTAVPGTGA